MLILLALIETLKLSKGGKRWNGTKTVKRASKERTEDKLPAYMRLDNDIHE